MRFPTSASVRPMMGREIGEIGGALLQTDGWYGSGSMATRRSSLRGPDLLRRSWTNVRRVAVSSAVAAAVVDSTVDSTVDSPGLAVVVPLVCLSFSSVLLLMMLEMWDEM